MTLHIDNLRGDNAHHQCETVFKAFARALRMAVERDPRAGGVDAVDQRRRCSAHRGHSTMSIAVVDYGMGNLRSVAKALAHVAPGPQRGRHLRRRGRSARADRVVLPGQSAMPDCMRELDDERPARRGARGRARHARSSASASACRCCSSASEEGPTPGLGVLPGASCAFATTAMVDADGERLKVPHMGWSPVRQARAHPLWEGIDGRRAVLFRAQLPSGARRPALTAGDGRLSVAVYLRGCAG